MGRVRALVLGLAVALVGCSDATTGVDDRIVGGVDLDLLFAPPTAAEIDAVAADWAARGPTAQAVTVELDTIIPVDTATIRIRIVGHEVDGEVHYGAVLSNDAAAPRSQPIIVYAHGGADGATVEEVLLQLAFVGDLGIRVVWIVPSFRSESISFGARSWRSEGAASPWDRDVDDALALLDVTLDVEPAADSASVGVLGFSRGGGVALLMGIRDPRIDRIVEFFGPTDFFAPYAQDVVEDALRGSSPGLPGFDTLDRWYLQPLVRGEIDIAAARDQLVRRSPVLFAERLPDLQIHHGTDDTVVDVDQAQSLIDAMAAIGRGEPEFEAYLYEGAGHNPLTMSGSVGRAVQFLQVLLGVAVQ